MMEHGQFRQDLYYRLNVIELRMPPLREMTEDIPALAQAILEKHGRMMGAPVPALASEALAVLGRHHFSGNVRELENVLERALALCDGKSIEAADLWLEMTPAGSQLATAIGDDLPLPEYLEAIEKQAILDALEKNGYNKTAAARQLGVSFRALRYRLAKLGLSRDDEES
jgi:two-component system response regulator PilR (NtrC family)